MRNKTKATLTLAACAILAAGTLPASPFANFFTGSAGVFLIGLLTGLQLPRLPLGYNC